MIDKGDIFIDSGAFSAWRLGITIDIDDYIAFIKKYFQYITAYAVLDVIGDAEKSYDNQKYMEKKGLMPIPIYHTGKEDVSWLKRYVDEGYDYIGIGGVAGTYTSTKEITNVFDHLWSDILTDRDGMPKTKVHGFGIGQFDIILRYPWYSVDTSSWIQNSSFGGIYIPYSSKGKYVYSRRPREVVVSLRNEKIVDEKEEDLGFLDIKSRSVGYHYRDLSPLEKSYVLRYLHHIGIDFGRSKFFVVHPKYKLKDGERWYGKKGRDGQRQVERIVKRGVCNDRVCRVKVNFDFMKGFSDYINETNPWPWPFKRKTMKTWT